MKHVYALLSVNGQDLVWEFVLPLVVESGPGQHQHREHSRLSQATSAFMWVFV